ncbi:hypothetical protein EVAR_47900_1 [Eumeta japonica]|uniref:Uncharacterized protein n=1 Tax=Eumeta variegata TaxID=151549 RepID=A0A4C1YAK1_EUMVA|nr:hypothetical protein EVAR_47900_1 [Eumeta japonica]
MFDNCLPEPPLEIEVQFAKKPEAGDQRGFPVGSSSVTSSLGCRMLLNLAARSSRFACVRAEVSVDRGLWGVARRHLSGSKNRLPFPCPKIDCPYPARPAPAHHNIARPRPGLLCPDDFISDGKPKGKPKRKPKREHQILTPSPRSNEERNPMNRCRRHRKKIIHTRRVPEREMHKRACSFLRTSSSRSCFALHTFACESLEQLLEGHGTATGPSNDPDEPRNPFYVSKTFRIKARKENRAKVLFGCVSGFFQQFSLRGRRGPIPRRGRAIVLPKGRPRPAIYFIYFLKQPRRPPDGRGRWLTFLPRGRRGFYSRTK